MGGYLTPSLCSPHSSLTPPLFNSELRCGGTWGWRGAQQVTSGEASVLADAKYDAYGRHLPDAFLGSDQSEKTLPLFVFNCH